MTEDKRSALFRETPSETLGRVVLGTAWALKPRRLGNLVPMLRMQLAGLSASTGDLPDVAAISETSELAGIAHDLSVPNLMEAYRRGLFPHGHIGSPKWVSPAMRGVAWRGVAQGFSYFVPPARHDASGQIHRDLDRPPLIGPV